MQPETSHQQLAPPRPQVGSKRPQFARRIPLIGLFCADAISLLGNTLTGVALPWFVLETTGRATETGITAFFGAIPLVLGALFGGIVVDRLGYKRTSMLADLASGVMVALVPLLYATIGLPFWLLMVLVFLGALFDTPGVSAREALLPDVAKLARVRLERANALDEGIQGFILLIGPALAGLLIVIFGPVNVLWLNACTFAISLGITALTQPRLRRRHTRAQTQGYIADMREGLHFIFTNNLIWVITVLATVLIFLNAPIVSVIMPVYIQATYGDSTTLGIVLSAQGGGAILGALLYGFIGHSVSARRLLIGGLMGIGGAMAVLSMLPPLPILIVSAFVEGIAVGIVNPLINTTLQQRIPAAMRGRVFGTVAGLALAAAPFSILIVGYLLDIVGVQPILVGITVCFLGIAISTTVLRSLHDLDKHAPSSDASKHA